MKIVEAAEVRQRLTMPVCIDLMRASLRNWRPGPIPSRCAPLPCCRAERSSGLSQACFGDCFGAKRWLSAFPQNAGTQYPSHIGYVLLFEGEHGSFPGMADAAVITEIRTGAVSRVATDLLCPAGRPPPRYHRGGSAGAVSPGCHDRCAGHPFRDRLRPKHPGGPPLLPGDGEKFGVPVTAATASGRRYTIFTSSAQ